MLNKIMLIGNLGKDPELNVTQEGTPVTKFTLAVNRNTKTSTGERKEETEWFNIVVWRQLAETCERYLHKGSKVYIEGRLQTRQWDDKDGNKRYTTEIRADRVVLLGGGGRGGGGAAARGGDESMGTHAPAPESSEPLTDDDIPF